MSADATRPSQHASSARVTAAIMQPYFFPYIGYFQLMAAADVFVVHDDVQYIKGGWINRNRILFNGEPHWIVLSVEADVHTRHVNQRRYVSDSAPFRKVVRQIQAAYRTAPRFHAVFPVIEEVLAFGDRNVAAFNFNLLRTLARWLGLRSRIVASSEIHKDEFLRGAPRIVVICAAVGATRYVNPIGGVTLYRSSEFAASGIDLRFLRPTPRVYSQFGPPHVPELSIIDVMMFNDMDTVQTMLGEFELLEPATALTAGSTDA